MENPDAGAEEEVVSLAELAAGKPQYDVCRIFLASLQLANTGNIEIETVGGSRRRRNRDGDGIDGKEEEEEEDVRVVGLDQLRFKLMSTERTNFFEYRAPSANAAAHGANAAAPVAPVAAAVAATTAKKGKKKGGKASKRAFGSQIAPNVAIAEHE